MTIQPQYNVFGPHTWTIKQVSLTTMFLTSKASSLVSIFSNSVSNSDANFVLSMIQIRSDNSRGLGSMFVIDPNTKVIRNSITTEGIVSIPQLKGLFGNPIYAFNVNPNSSNVTIQAIEKTYIDGSNSTVPVPSSTDTSQKPNCPALKAAADRASAYARQATVALAGGAMVATAVCRESFKSLNFWTILLACGGSMVGLEAATFYVYLQWQDANVAYQEYEAACVKNSPLSTPLFSVR